jgi:hypothetical protein
MSNLSNGTTVQWDGSLGHALSVHFHESYCLTVPLSHLIYRKGKVINSGGSTGKEGKWGGQPGQWDKWYLTNRYHGRPTECPSIVPLGRVSQ